MATRGGKKYYWSSSRIGQIVRTSPKIYDLLLEHNGYNNQLYNFTISSEKEEEATGNMNTRTVRYTRESLTCEAAEIF